MDKIHLINLAKMAARDKLVVAGPSLEDRRIKEIAFSVLGVYQMPGCKANKSSECVHMNFREIIMLLLQKVVVILAGLL